MTINLPGFSNAPSPLLQYALKREEKKSTSRGKETPEVTGLRLLRLPDQCLAGECLVLLNCQLAIGGKVVVVCCRKRELDG